MAVAEEFTQRVVGRENHWRPPVAIRQVGSEETRP